MLASLYLPCLHCEPVSLEATEWPVAWNCCLILCSVFVLKGQALLSPVSSTSTASHSTAAMLDGHPGYWNLKVWLFASSTLVSQSVCLWIVPTYTVNGPQWKNSKRTLASHRRSSDLGINKPRWSTFLLRWSVILINLITAFPAVLDPRFKFL